MNAIVPLTLVRPAPSSRREGRGRGRGGGAVQRGASTASARCTLERLGAAGAVRRLVPGRGRHPSPTELDAVAYSFDRALDGHPGRRPGSTTQGDVMPRDATRIEGAASSRARTVTRPRPPAKVRFVKHHVAHAASRRAGRPAASRTPCWCSTAAARRTATWPAATSTGGSRCWPARRCRTRLGLLYEDLTEHLGFLRSSDEYKVMAMASYGKPRFAGELSELIRATDDGGFRTDEDRLRRVRAAAGQGRRLDRGARRPRRQRPAAAGGDAARPGALAARAHRRQGAHPGRRRRPQLRGQQPHPRRGPVRAGLGASRPPATPARHWAGPCTSPATSARRPSRCPAPTSAAAGPRRRSSSPDDGGDRLRAAPRRRRRRGRGAGGQRDRRLVPGPQRVSARARWATARCWRTRATRRTWSG